VLNNPIYALATLVDPRTKHYFPELPEHVKTIISRFVMSKVTVKSTQSITVSESVSKSGLHGLLPSIPSSIKPPSTFNIDAYVNVPIGSSAEQFLSCQPVELQELYFEVCGIPAASSDIERLFSACGFINSKLRTSVKPENLEQQSLLKKNWSIIKDFNKRDYPTKPERLHDWTENLPAYETPFYPDEEIQNELAEVEVGLANDEAVTSESSGDEVVEPVEELNSGPWWTASQKPKSFSQQMSQIKSGSKRKRSLRNYRDESPEEIHSCGLPNCKCSSLDSFHR